MNFTNNFFFKKNHYAASPTFLMNMKHCATGNFQLIHLLNIILIKKIKFVPFIVGSTKSYPLKIQLLERSSINLYGNLCMENNVKNNFYFLI